MVFLANAPVAGTNSGRFWFDRAPQPTHLVPWTRESEADRQRWWDACSELLR